MAELKDLLSGNKVDQVIKAITDGVAAGAVDLEGLKALHAAESAGGKRQGVLVELGKLLDAAAQNPPPTDDDAAAAEAARAEAAAQEAAARAASVTAAGKAARGEKPAEKPAWQKPDYTGPLTCDQAFWRNQHIKVK